MKYVFRLSIAAKEKLDEVAPPRAHQRSSFIRQAIFDYLGGTKQNLADRPHLRGRNEGYKQVCSVLAPDLIDSIKAVYPEVSVSVVIQASVLDALRHPAPRIQGFSSHLLEKSDDRKPPAHPDSKSLKRSLKGSG